MNKKRTHSELICDVSEISGLFTDSSSLESFLQKIVVMIAEHMQSDVCSIYLYYDQSRELVLRANTGLNKECIGNIKLKLGEGLTGLALKELRPICERQASQNSNFRYFSGLGEERFESFLAVPINRGATMIGTLVIQNTQKNYFKEEDITALRAISSQLANTIEMTRLFLSLGEKEKVSELQTPVVDKKLTSLEAKIGSPGFALGKVVVLNNDRSFSQYKSLANQQKLTLADFQKAVDQTEDELANLQKQIEETLSDVASLIFTAQILMLKDNAFIDRIKGLIEESMNPIEAIIEVVNDYMIKFERLPNAYLREKAHDVQDIGLRLLDNLLGRERQINELAKKVVIVAELLPSDALKLSSQEVQGIVLLRGGVTAHVSILCRSLQIPLLIVDEPALLSLPESTQILLDAEQGHIYIDPSKDILDSFKDKQDVTADLKRLQASMKDKTLTKDKIRVQLLANVNLLGDLNTARDFKAEGIGLYRTEFPFIVRNDFPSEEEQYVIYKRLVDHRPGQEVTFRTLDIGGDKVLSYFEHHLKEKNPSLGMRSIRFSLKHIDIFSQQIRAILRAGIGSDLKIMFPMISSLDEFIEAKKVVKNCIASLKEEKIECHTKPEIGLMIELPAVLEVIDELAQEADFFSIGTNDFIQYMLAVDRTNEKVSDLYLPHHPAILRALKKIVDAAKKHKKDVSICGDMAQETKYLTYFLGIGIRKLSLNPSLLPKIQFAINKIDVKKAEKDVMQILAKKHLKDIERIIDAASV